MEALKVIRKGNTILFKYSGELTLDVVEEIKSEVTSILEEEITDQKIVIFDLSDVSFVDSSGIGFLIHVKNRISSMDRKCYLLNPSNVVKKTLSLVNLLNFFNVIENEDDIFLDS